MSRTCGVKTADRHRRSYQVVRKNAVECLSNSVRVDVYHLQIRWHLQDIPQVFFKLQSLANWFDTFCLASSSCCSLSWIVSHDSSLANFRAALQEIKGTELFMVCRRLAIESGRVQTVMNNEKYRGIDDIRKWKLLSWLKEINLLTISSLSRQLLH